MPGTSKRGLVSKLDIHPMEEGVVLVVSFDMFLQPSQTDNIKMRRTSHSLILSWAELPASLSPSHNARPSQESSVTATPPSSKLRISSFQISRVRSRQIHLQAMPAVAMHCVKTSACMMWTWDWLGRAPRLQGGAVRMWRIRLGLTVRLEVGPWECSSESAGLRFWSRKAPYYGMN